MATGANCTSKGTYIDVNDIPALLPEAPPLPRVSFTVKALMHLPKRGCIQEVFGYLCCARIGAVPTPA